MSLSLVAGAATAFVPQAPCAGVAIRNLDLAMKGGLTRKERKQMRAADIDTKVDTKAMSGNVMPTGNGPTVTSWYDAGLRLDGSTVVPTPAVPAPAPAPVAKEPTPTPVAPPRAAVWNPKGLDVSQLPKLAQEQFVAAYLKSAPTYLDGSMTGDNAFDPWAPGPHMVHAHTVHLPLL